MPPEIVTALIADLDDRYGPGAADRALDVLLRTGAMDADTEALDGGGHRVRAEFHSVGDSTRAAVDLARSLAAHVGPDPDAGPGAIVPGVRVGLCTGPHVPVDGDPNAGPDGDPDADACPRASATALLAWAAPGQFLATAATVIVTAGGLPPGVDLVDRGSIALAPGRPAERVYELRIDLGTPGDRPIGGLGGAGDGSVARSNLDWARRAVGGPDGAHDLGDVIDAMTCAWRSAVGDGRHTVLVSGPGGAGKTRAAAELALRLHAEGALVLYGRWDPDVDAPYQGIREAFGVYADSHGTAQLRADLAGRADEIAGLLPDVAARVGGFHGAGADGDGPGADAAGDERARLFDAVEAWVAALTRRRPTLLVLDDVHWAEPASLLLIDHLHHAGAGIPLLIVVTAGADRAAPAAAADVLPHAEDGEVERIDLDH